MPRAINQIYGLQNVGTVLADFNGPQVASGWIATGGVGLPTFLDDPINFIEGTNGLRMVQADTQAGNLVRVYRHVPGGVSMVGFESLTVVTKFPNVTSRDKGASASIQIFLSSDGANSYTNSLSLVIGGGALTGNIRGGGGLNVFTFKRSEMGFTGAINLAAVTNIRLALTTPSVTEDMTWLSIRWNRRNRAMVAVTFDDGYDDGVAAAAIANPLGIPLTHYIIPVQIGLAGHLTLAQLATLAAAGDKICCHGTPNYTSEPDNGLSEMTNTIAYLKNLGYDWEHLSYPGGGYNDKVIAHARALGLKSARTIRGLTYSAGPPEVYSSQISHELDNTNWGFPNVYALNASPLSSVQTLSATLASVDRVIDRGGVLHLYGHKLDTVADSVTWTTADFTTLCQYIARRKREGSIDVVTIPDMYSRMNRARAIS